MNSARRSPHGLDGARLPASAGEAAAAPKPPGEGSWPCSRWLTLIALVFAVHVALIFAFGERKPVVSRAVTNVPTLKLADNPGEWLALNDPTLFALPHRKGFCAAVVAANARVDTAVVSLDGTAALAAVVR